MKNNRSFGKVSTIVCISTLLLLGVAAVSYAADPIKAFPAPQKVETGEGSAVISDNWGIIQDMKDEDNCRLSAYLSDRISDQFGLVLKLDGAAGARKEHRICFGKPEVKELSSSVKEGYVLKVSPGNIEILSNTPRGAFYGIQTLCQLVSEDKGKVYVPLCKITDYPAIGIRAVHFSGINPEKVKEQIEKVARLKYNMVIIESQVYFDLGQGENRVMMEDIFRFARERYLEPVPEVLSFASAQGIISQDPYSAEGIRVENREFQFVGDFARPVDGQPFANVIRDGSDEILVKSKDRKNTYAEGYDYEVKLAIPRFPFKAGTSPAGITRIPSGRIGEGESISVSYTYIENKPSFDLPDSSQTYCPSSERTYDIMSKTLQNVMSILKPKYISIGHDEIRGMNRDKRCRDRNMSNAQILAEDVNRLYGIIKNIDEEVQVLMWNDMLNPYYNGGDPAFNSKYEGMPGEAYAAIDYIPDDIILMTAAYDPDRSFCIKSSDFFDSKQFKYLVAGWKNKRNISDWAGIARGRKNCLGIIETTWYDWEGNFDNIKYAAEASWR